MAAAMADARLNNTTNASKANAALPIAKAAGEAVTGSTFGFTAGATGTSFTLSASIGSTSTSGGTTTSSVTYTATATAPRQAFFGGVKGLGLSGISVGSQTAVAESSTTSTTTSTGGGCLVTLGTSGTDIGVTGGAKIISNSCGIVSDSTTACGGSSKSVTGSIALNPCGQIQTSPINMASGATDVYGDGQGGSTATGPNGTGTPTYSSGGESDPYSALASAGLPEWPIMPTAPTVPYTFSARNTSPCGLSSSSSSSTVILAPCNYPNGISYGGGGSLELTSGNNSTTYGSTYTVAGGIDYTSGLSSSTAGKLDDFTYTSPSTFIPITIYSTGTLSKKGAVNDYALKFEDASASAGPTSSGSTSPGNIYYLNGGMEVDSTGPTLTMGQSVMLANAYSGNTTTGSSPSSGAMYLQDGNTTFTGGTYFFDGGLNIGGSATVTFGPGIYYIRNGELFIGNGAHVYGSCNLCRECPILCVKYVRQYVFHLIVGSSDRQSEVTGGRVCKILSLLQIMKGTKMCETPPVINPAIERSMASDFGGP